MKKIYILLLLIIAGSFQINAQSDATEKADKLYEQLRYVDAAKAYEKLIKKGERSQHVYTNLANAYFFNSDFKSAEQYFKRATNKNPDSETLFRYAQTLKANEKYDLSNTIMSQFAGLVPNDNRSKAFKANPNYLADITGMNPAYAAEALSLNGEASDFAAQRIGDKIYFASARNNKRKNYAWNKEPYLDIYEASIDENGMPGEGKLLEGDVNTKFHEGTLDITPDGKYMFFTRVDYIDGDYEEATDGESKLNIYRALKAGGEWRDVRTTSLESQEYGVGHPSITADGKTIYFASEAPGGQGGTDIYKADLKNGKISDPVNLGPTVNTSGDDSFPMMASDGTLYFSSNGHLGLGSLDVFMYKDGKVTNMGAPINSAMDDFAFTYDSETGKGFVSSNRKGGKGSDDIYAINRIDMCEVMVTVTAIDAQTNQPISGAIVSLQDADGNSLPSQTTNGEGQAMFTTDCNKEFVVRGARDEYESGQSDLTVTEEDTAMVTVNMEPIIPDPPIVENKIILNKIYFDLDKSNIRPDAALELDRLVSYMKKYPDLEVMAETYADTRGGDAYNLALTQRRAESLVAYVVSQGVDSSRLTAVGRGEANPVVDCLSKRCTQEDYELSRRSEFTITKK